VHPLLQHGARVIWRSHIGHDTRNPAVDRGWQFLMPFLEGAHQLVFSRRAYIPPLVDRSVCAIVPPSIDPCSAKNQPLAPAAIRAILVHAGVVEGPIGNAEPSFRHEDGSPGRVDHGADILRLGRTPPADVPMVVQVSRWDRLKDHLGVLRGFCRLLDRAPGTNAQLVLAGPSVRAIADDPEGAEVFNEMLTAWRHLPHGYRRHIQLVNLPMADVEENAAIVNALQRHAAVVVQKSLHEGFGLTVAEAMWKARPVLATRVGGIQDQIEHERSGLLLDDPCNLDDFAALLERVLTDRELARTLGENAKVRVATHFVGLHSLMRYAEAMLKMP